MNSIGVSNSLDPDQAQHSVVPELGTKNLQSLSADDKVAASKEVNYLIAGKFCFLIRPLLNFFQKIIIILSQCQTVRIQIRPDILSGLIWVQTVCKGNQ